MIQAMRRNNCIENIIAFCLLVGPCVFGVLELFTSASITGHYTPLIALDVTVYIVLIALACFVFAGLRAARWVYAVVAIVWYLALIFVLPWEFGHEFNLFVVFMQVVVTALAFGFLSAC